MRDLSRRLWLRPFGTRTERGTTLTEFMVAIGLFTFVVASASTLLLRIQKSNYSAQSLSKANNEIDMWQATIKRDLDWRKIDSSGNRGGYHALEGNIDLYPMAMVRNTSQPDTYHIWYNAYCQNMPSGMKAFYTQRYGNHFNFSAAYLTANYPDDLKCMRHVNCADGKFPIIVRTRDNRPDLSIHSYPGDNQGSDGAWRGGLPTGNMNADNVAAAAICIETINNINDRVILEAAIVQDTGKFKFERREIIAPRRNTASLQQIQN